MSGIRYSKLKKNDDIYLEEQCPRCKSSNKIKLEQDVLFKRPVDSFRCFSCKKVSWINEIRQMGSDKEILHLLGYDNEKEIVITDGEEVAPSLTHKIFNVFAEFLND